MSIVHIDLDAEYAPKTKDEDIKLKVMIGDGQSGAYVIFLGQELKASNKTANLGTRKEVTGKTTTIVVTIMDKLKETNWTSVTLEISEGNNKTGYGPYEKQVPHHLDTAIYTIKIMHS